MIKIGILGIDGAMGRLILDLALKEDEISVTHGYTIPESENIGMDIGSLVGAESQEVKVTDINEMDNHMQEDTPDLFIDFTVAPATEINAYKILEYNVPLVIGTTGLSKKFLADMAEISNSKNVPMVISTNMAIGMNVVFEMVKQLASRLDGWEIEIIEKHHHRKQDAPSGTALTIASNIADSIGVNLDKVAKYGRNKGPNPRKYGKQEIGIHSIRAGDIVGDHTIIYAGNGERIEFTHKAHSRSCFASGAIEAAKFLSGKKGKSGIYNMKDVLNL